MGNPVLIRGDFRLFDNALRFLASNERKITSNSFLDSKDWHRRLFIFTLQFDMGIRKVLLASQLLLSSNTEGSLPRPELSVDGEDIGEVEQSETTVSFEGGPGAVILPN